MMRWSYAQYDEKMDYADKFGVKINRPRNLTNAQLFIDDSSKKINRTIVRINNESPQEEMKHYKYI